MFELAARLVGVYKVNHMTKSVTIENKDYVHGRAGPAKQQAHAQGQAQGQQQTQQQVHHQQSHNPPLHNTQNKGLSEEEQKRLRVLSSSSNSSLAYRLKTNA